MTAHEENYNRWCAQNAEISKVAVFLLQNALKQGDMEKIQKKPTKTLEETPNKSDRRDSSETIEVIKSAGPILLNLIPDTGPPDKLLDEFENFNNQNRKNKTDDLKSILQLCNEERQRRRNPNLEKIEYQNKKTFDNIWKNMFKSS
jgi:hypothetical protein